MALAAGHVSGRASGLQKKAPWRRLSELPGLDSNQQPSG
jgi:hypothetical protein